MVNSSASDMKTSMEGFGLATNFITGLGKFINLNIVYTICII